LLLVLVLVFVSLLLLLLCCSLLAAAGGAAPVWVVPGTLNSLASGLSWATAAASRAAAVNR
jgi:hypothetical protein